MNFRPSDSHYRIVDEIDFVTKLAGKFEFDSLSSIGLKDFVGMVDRFFFSFKIVSTFSSIYFLFYKIYYCFVSVSGSAEPAVRL